MENLTSLFGFFVFAFIAWLLSCDRKKINWRPIAGGIALQFLFAAIVFLVPFTRGGFIWLSNVFSKTLEYSRDGIIFVFGDLGAQNSPQGLILAFQVFPFIIVFASLMSLLYYLKIIPFIIKLFARFISSTLRTSGAESLCASSNVFVGIESATTVRPYLEDMTRSELFTVLVVGMSTVASSVLALYVSFLHSTFPAIAGHLVSASIISVPAAFVISKLMVPEIETPVTSSDETCEPHNEDKAKGITESLITGANAGAKLAIGVVVTLIAFIGMLGIARGLFGYFTGNPHFIENLLAYIFYPFAWLTGVAPQDVPAVAKMLGERLILTEIPSYIALGKFAAAGGDKRTVLITSYSLCGFAHIASMAIFVGGIGALAPKKMPLLSKLGPRALLGATLVTLMTGAVAGIFYFGQKGLIQ